MAKNSINKGGNKVTDMIQSELMPTDIMPPKDFQFANVSYEDTTREITRDNPSASIVLNIAEQAGLGKTAKNVFSDITKTLTRETADFAMRDVAFWGVKKLGDFVGANLQGHEKEKLAIQLVTNGAVVVSKPVMVAHQVYQDDKERRSEVREQISAFADAYDETIRASSFNPLGNPKNAVLAKLEQRFELQAHERDAEMLTSAMLGTAQAISRKVHSDNLTKNVNALRDSEIAKIPADTNTITAQAEAILASPRLQTKDLFFNTPLGEVGTVFNPLKPFNDPKLSSTTGIMAGAAFASTQAERMIEGERQAPSGLIAADLILYLSEQMKLGEVDGGVVHLDKLRKDFNLSKDSFGAGGSSMPLEQYIELIFHTNVHDQEGGKIPERFNEKLRDSSQKIAEAILGNGGDFSNESSLNPLALIELVGSGKIVAHDGLHVANAEIIGEELQQAMQKMPVAKQIDSYRYVDKLGNSLGLKPDEAVEDFKNKLRGMDSETRDFIALLVPNAVLVNELGLPENAVRDAKDRGSEYAIENVKQVVEELCARPEKELLNEGLSKAQLKVLHENYGHIQNGDDDKLLQSLGKRDESGLGFAILCSTSYMNELAGGKKLIGLDAANTVKPFDRDKTVNDNIASPSTIEPSIAEIAECSLKAKSEAKGGELVRAS